MSYTKLLNILLKSCLFSLSMLQTSLPFPFDLESVIDDWILLGFLVGNDFLPNLPNMHIKQVYIVYTTCYMYMPLQKYLYIVWINIYISFCGWY